MAKSKRTDYVAIANELLDVFNRISVSLSCIGDAVKDLQRADERYELHFGSSGVFRGMTSRSTPAFSHTADSELALSVVDACEYLPGWVDDLQGNYAKADEFLAGMPKEITQLLSQHNDNKPWQPMVRQECLDVLRTWTGKGPRHVPCLLDRVKRSDPHEGWADIRERLDFYRSQILAIRDVAPVKGDKRQPTVNDRMIAELACNLEEAKGWTAKRWAEHLNRGQTTVKETETWKSLTLLRQQAKAEKREDRRRR